MFADRLPDLGNFLFAADEAGQLNGQIIGRDIQRLERRKVKR